MYNIQNRKIYNWYEITCIFTYFHCRVSIRLHGNRSQLFSNVALVLLLWTQTLAPALLQITFPWLGLLGWTVEPLFHPMMQHTLQYQKVDSVQDCELKSSMKKKEYKLEGSESGIIKHSLRVSRSLQENSFYSEGIKRIFFLSITDSNSIFFICIIESYYILYLT